MGSGCPVAHILLGVCACVRPAVGALTRHQSPPELEHGFFVVLSILVTEMRLTASQRDEILWWESWSSLNSSHHWCGSESQHRLRMGLKVCRHSRGPKNMLWNFLESLLGYVHFQLITSPSDLVQLQRTAFRVQGNPSGDVRGDKTFPGESPTHEIKTCTSADSKIEHRFKPSSANSGDSAVCTRVHARGRI